MYPPNSPCRWCAVLLLSALLCAPAFSQSEKFDAAEVVVSPPTLDYHKRGSDGPYFSGDQLQIRRATLVNLIAVAWGVDENSVLGGPAWLDMDRFDIRAKAPAPLNRTNVQPMLQALLAERFGLAAHKGTQQLPGWALTAGRNPQLKKSDGSENGCRYDAQNPPSGGQPAVAAISCHNLTMTDLARLIPNGGDYIVDGLTVVDRTGLEGSWDFTLKFAPSKSVALINHTPTLFDAIEQLGLRLEPSTVAVNGIVVDRVNQRPSANPPDVAKVFPQAPAEFEAIVIRRSPPGDRTLNGYTAGDNTRVQYLQGGRVNIQGSLQGLVRWVWGINTVRIAGLPPWANEDSWDISAKPPVATNDSDVISEMLRSLLVSRFGMKYHFEERPFLSGTLVADKPKLKKADPAERTGCKEGPATPSRSDARDENPLLSRLLTCRNVSMAQFAYLLFKGMASGYVSGPVFDATGLEGGWDFTLSFSAPAQVPASTDADPTGALSLPDAMQKQIGIRMEMQKHPVEVLVIDSLERTPTEN